MLLQVSHKPENESLNCSKYGLTASIIFNVASLIPSQFSLIDIAIATTTAITPTITPIIGNNAELKKAAIPPAAENTELRPPNDTTHIPIIAMIGPNTASKPPTTPATIIIAEVISGFASIQPDIALTTF